MNKAPVDSKLHNEMHLLTKRIFDINSELAVLSFHLDAMTIETLSTMDNAKFQTMGINLIAKLFKHREESLKVQHKVFVSGMETMHSWKSAIEISKK